jgi:hypothetical protein
MTAYVDLDGVLVEFVRGALTHHKRSIPPWEVQWQIDKQLEMTSDEFWGPLDRWFWQWLPWTTEGKPLLAAIEKLFGENVVLMTAPSPNIETAAGKIEWVKRELPQYEHRLFIGREKHRFAAPDKLLIDDKNENVYDFRAAGGKALLIPRAWNDRRDEIDDNGGFNVFTIYDELKELAS